MNPFEVLLALLCPQGKDDIVKQERYVEEADQSDESHKEHLHHTCKEKTKESLKMNSAFGLNKTLLQCHGSQSTGVLWLMKPKIKNKHYLCKKLVLFKAIFSKHPHKE